jgi:hypothetical protein
VAVKQLEKLTRKTRDALWQSHRLHHEAKPIGCQT